MSNKLKLVGHANLTGAYPSPVVPIASDSDGRIVSIYHAYCGYDAIEVADRSAIVQYDATVLARLMEFVPSEHHLFAFSESDVVLYRRNQEREFCRELYEAGSLDDKPFTLLSIARSAKEPRVTKAAIMRCVEHFEEEDARIAQAWYDCELREMAARETELFRRVRLPLSWRAFVDARRTDRVSVRPVTYARLELSEMSSRSSSAALSTKYRYGDVLTADSSTGEHFDYLELVDEVRDDPLSGTLVGIIRTYESELIAHAVSLKELGYYRHIKPRDLAICAIPEALCAIRMAFGECSDFSGIVKEKMTSLAHRFGSYQDEERSASYVMRSSLVPAARTGALRELHLIVEKSLLAIPLLYRQLLKRAYFEGMTTAYLARHLEPKRSVRVVASQVRRGVELWRMTIRDQCGDWLLGSMFLISR